MTEHRKPARWAWLGAILGTLLALIAFAPVLWVGALLSHYTSGKVQLLNTGGTVWSGHGDVLLSGGEGSRGQTALPQGLRWKLRPGWSQGPVLRMSLSSPCCTEQPMSIALRPSFGGAQVRVDAFSSRWPAAMLVGLGTPWNTLRMDGQLLVQSPGFSLALNGGRPRLDGQLVVEAHDLATRVSTLRPLGSYRVEFRSAGDGDNAALKLATLKGGLLLDGDGQWSGGRLRFRGVASAAPGQESALANLLSIIGRRDGARTLLTFG